MQEPNAEVLARAFQRWGVEPGSYELLGGSNCRVYAFRREDADLVLRLTSRNSGRVLQMRNELDWLDYLARQKAAVCAPVPSTRGRSLEVLREGFGRGYLAAVFQRAGGTAVTSAQSELWTPALFEKCGWTLGEIHALSKGFRPRFGLRPFRWTGSGLVRLARRVLPATERRVLGRIERYCREFSVCRAGATTTASSTATSTRAITTWMGTACACSTSAVAFTPGMPATSPSPSTRRCSTGCSVGKRTWSAMPASTSSPSCAATGRRPVWRRCGSGASPISSSSSTCRSSSRSAPSPMGRVTRSSSSSGVRAKRRAVPRCRLRTAIPRVRKLLTEKRRKAAYFLRLRLRCLGHRDVISRRLGVGLGGRRCGRGLVLGDIGGERDRGVRLSHRGGVGFDDARLRLVDRRDPGHDKIVSSFFLAVTFGSSFAMSPPECKLPVLRFEAYHPRTNRTS